MKSITMPQAKMLFGFLLLLVIGALCATIAIGHVRQETSYGLPEILGGLLVLAGGFANWAFGESRSSSGGDPVPLRKFREDLPTLPHTESESDGIRTGS